MHSNTMPATGVAVIVSNSPNTRERKDSNGDPPRGLSRAGQPAQRRLMQVAKANRIYSSRLGDP